MVAGLWYFFLREEAPKGHTDRVDLTAGAYSGDMLEQDPELFVLLSVTNGMPDSIAFDLRLLNLEGSDLPLDAGYEASVEIVNLNDGSRDDAVALQSVPDATTPAWRIANSAVDTEGWWRLTATIQRPEGEPLVSEFTLLVPDPNLTGFDTPPTLETDPEAASMLNTAITNMSQWDSLRWWEWLSGGNGSIILAEFSVTTPDSNGQPDSFSNQLLLSAVVLPLREGEAPPAPRWHHNLSVTIGDDAMRVRDGGTPEATSATRYLPIQQYPETYAGATDVRFGITEQVNGREAQIVTFHVPSITTQSEAYYAFWIDVETGELLQLSMLANNHYMMWVYTDVNEPFVIEFPE